MSQDTRIAIEGVKRYEWERTLKASEAGQTTRLVGMMLATYANKDGTNAHPGVPRLMSDCQIGSDKTVRTHLAKLVALGLIHRTFHAQHSGDGYADVYMLTRPVVEVPVSGSRYRQDDVGNEDRVTAHQSLLTNPLSSRSHSMTGPNADASGRDEEELIEELADEVSHRYDVYAAVNGMAAKGEPYSLIVNTANAMLRDEIPF